MIILRNPHVQLLSWNAFYNFNKYVVPQVTEYVIDQLAQQVAKTKQQKEKQDEILSTSKPIQ